MHSIPDAPLCGVSVKMSDRRGEYATNVVTGGLRVKLINVCK